MSSSYSHNNNNYKEAMESSQVAEFFRGKIVLITGGAGFVGKACIEKILRCCPQVQNIYVLIRPKKSSTVEERLNNLLDGSLFTRVRARDPKCVSKVKAIHGDITTENVCIHPEDAEFIHNNVHIVLHCAATIKFDLTLKDALQSNVCGTKNVLNFAKKIRNLQVLVHVSTAFSNCYNKHIDEVIYPTSVKPDDVIQMTEWMPDHILKTITPQILGGHPNTYCYSKQMGEQVVQNFWEDNPMIPMCIVRPSIVIATANEEPIAGWVDNFNHLSGLLITAGMGITRIFYTSLDAKADVIPLDHVISLVVAAAWKTATVQNDSKKLTIYNCCSGQDNPFIPRVTVPWGYEGFWKTPPDNIYWYPWQICTTSFTMFKFLDKIFHFIPAHVVDMIDRIQGRRPRMVALYKRTHEQFNSFRFFMNNVWEFQTDNTRALYKELCSQDQKNFNFNMKSLDWKTYMHNYVWGMKRFVLKEKEENLDLALKNLRNKYILHQSANVLIGIVVAWAAYIFLVSFWLA